MNTLVGEVADLSYRTIRLAIADQVCPWCGAGPFLMLAGHTSRAHGIYTAHLHRLAGYLRKDRVADPSLSEDGRRLLPPGIKYRPDMTVCGRCETRPRTTLENGGLADYCAECAVVWRSERGRKRYVALSPADRRALFDRTNANRRRREPTNRDRGICRHGHALTGANLYYFDGGTRSRCRACRTEAHHRQDAARRLARKDAPMV